MDKIAKVIAMSQSYDPQVHIELEEIKERLTTIETLQARVHRDEIARVITEAIGGSEIKKKILAACVQPQTYEELMQKTGVPSKPALSNHLKELHEHGVVEKSATGGRVAYKQARIISKLSRRDLQRLLG